MKISTDLHEADHLTIISADYSKIFLNPIIIRHRRALFNFPECFICNIPISSKHYEHEPHFTFVLSMLTNPTSLITNKPGELWNIFTLDRSNVERYQLHRTIAQWGTEIQYKIHSRDEYSTTLNHYHQIRGILDLFEIHLPSVSRSVTISLCKSSNLFIAIRKIISSTFK